MSVSSLRRIIQEKTADQQVDTSKTPKTRIELHCHLEGSLRHATLLELLRENSPSHLPGDGTLTDLVNNLTISSPIDLNHFLEKYQFILPALVDSIAAVERIAFEFVEDACEDGVLYFEVRSSPHFLCSLECLKSMDSRVSRMEHLRNVVNAILRGLERGKKENAGIDGRLILCYLRFHPAEWIDDVVDLCDEFRNAGVVGIDIAGTDQLNSAFCELLGDESVNPRYAKTVIEGFKRAKGLGIHRTVHAGQDGCGKSVELALDVLQAERIGHGYRLLDAPEVYARVLREKVHLEVCPHSSLITGAVPLAVAKHPIVQFAEDGTHFSINRDDPTLTFARLHDEYSLLMRWGLTEAHFIRVNLNAVEASFLSPPEKGELKKKLLKAYFDNTE